MDKKRVYQVAKDFHISSEALGTMLKDIGFEVKSHMSVVDDKMLNSIKKQFEKQQSNALKDIDKKKRINEAIDKKTTVETKKQEPPKSNKGKRPHRPNKPATTKPVENKADANKSDKAQVKKFTKPP